MADEKKLLDENTLDTVSGGMQQVSFYEMTVGYNLGGGYLALRSAPDGRNPNNIIYQLYSGYKLKANNATQYPGYDMYGNACTYYYVCYDNEWGYVNANYVY